MSRCASQCDAAATAGVEWRRFHFFRVGVRRWLWPAVRRNASPHLSCRGSECDGTSWVHVSDPGDGGYRGGGTFIGPESQASSVWVQNYWTCQQCWAAAWWFDTKTHIPSRVQSICRIRTPVWPTFAYAELGTGLKSQSQSSAQKYHLQSVCPVYMYYCTRYMTNWQHGRK